MSLLPASGVDRYRFNCFIYHTQLHTINNPEDLTFIDQPVIIFRCDAIRESFLSSKLASIYVAQIVLILQTVLH